MSRLLAIFLVTFFALTSSVLAFSTGPGTCLVSGMKGNPHGATPSKNATVTTDVKLVSAGTYSITISGSGTINGLLLYAIDSNGTRFGSFTKPPTGFGPKAGCGGTTPATNTLGHINPSPKTLPLTFTWSDGGYLAANTTASFAGIAMTSTESVWYVLSGGVIPASTNATSSGSSSTASSAAATTIPSGDSSASAGAASSTSAKNTSVVYSYGASASSTTQVAWSLVVSAFLSVFATFLL